MAGCASAVGVVEYGRKPVAWRFAQTDVARDDRVEHHVAEMALQLVEYLIGKTQAGIVHGEQKSFNFQVGIKFGFYDPDGVEELADSLQCEIFGLNGNNDGIGRGERIDSDQPQRRRTVDEHKIIIVAHLCKQAFEYFLALRLVDKFELGADKVDARADKVELVDASMFFGYAKRIVVEKSFLDRRGHFFRIDAQSRSGVCLRVGIDDERRFSERCQRGRKVDGGGRFSDTAFLICNGNYFSHKFVFAVAKKRHWRPMAKRFLRKTAKLLISGPDC